MVSRLLLALLLLKSCCAIVRADKPIDYQRDVKPVLMSRCAACHGALQQKAKLRLDASPLIRQGSKNGPVVVPGKSADSLLVDAVLGKDRTRMPPEKDGPALTEAQIAALRAWIDQGAKMPDEVVPEDPRKHWAFQKPVRPLVPQIRNAKSEIRNPVDSFLDARRDGLSTRREATRETLLRRVYLDLIGLPPTAAELDEARNDKSPDWYEKVVEKLLDDPRHGERWARHWMDVWRYSDWYGRRAVPDVWNSAPQVYRWRNWIIRSLNEDRGYDRLLQEMLAGDEIAPQDEGARDATGYLVRNWYALNPNQWMRDIVEHSGKAFLGLTFNCAHCHDHKYDPIAQEEYFRFRAFFEPLGLRQDRVAGEADPGPFQKYDYSVLRKIVKTGAVRVFDENPDAKTMMYQGGDEREVMKDRPPVTPAAPAFLDGLKLPITRVELPAEVAYPGLQPFVRHEERAAAENAVKVARSTLASTPGKLAELQLARAQAQQAALEARIAADDVKHGLVKGDAAALAKTASKAERLAALRAAEERFARAEQAVTANMGKPAELKKAEAEKTAAKAVLDAATKASTVDMATYTPLSPSYPKTSTGRRKALALWLTSRDNPLTARVAVNHIWKHYFNRPIVETVADFGRNGARPSHPELLDWLAVELMDGGWRMKDVHRLIVTSAAYRMQSTSAATELARDPDNRLLWRFPARRLQAETVRDTVLFVSGSLEQRFGGSSLDNVVDASVPRRSVYFSVFPEDGGAMRFLEMFDPPDPCDCYKRQANVIPQQALAMTNSRLLLEQSRLLARQISGSDDDFVQALYERVLSRRAAIKELELCRAFLAKQEALFRAAKVQPVANPEIGVPPSADPKLRAREGLVRVLFSHDDFVTVR